MSFIGQSLKVFFGDKQIFPEAEEKSIDDVYKYLVGLGTGMVRPSYPHEGICMNLICFMEQKYDQGFCRNVKNLMIDYFMDNFNCRLFPIKHNSKSPTEAFTLLEDLWKVLDHYDEDDQEYINDRLQACLGLAKYLKENYNENFMAS